MACYLRGSAVSPAKKVLGQHSAMANLKFLIFQQKSMHFHFALGPGIMYPVLLLCLLPCLYQHLFVVVIENYNLFL